MPEFNHPFCFINQADGELLGFLTEFFELLKKDVSSLGQLLAFLHGHGASTNALKSKLDLSFACLCFCIFNIAESLISK
ncbi:MAG: hypothetical protein K2U26_11675 [Cyclobacteriaceae bacterium]|nr:hypothetical protein [Cyclobacteriaceae bacterium]